MSLSEILLNEGILSYENTKLSRLYNAEFKAPTFGLFLLVAQNSEIVWTYYEGEEYSWLPKNKDLHLKSIYSIACLCHYVPVPYSGMGP